MIRTGFLLGALLAAGAAQAQGYKCVDTGGKTVYSQVPCPKASKATTLQRTAPAVPQAAAAKGDAGKGDAAKASGPKTTAEMEQDFRKRRLEQEEARKKQDQAMGDAKAKQENCRNARLSLANLESGARQSRTNEKGERYFLDDGQIASEKDRMRRAVEASCK